MENEIIELSKVIIEKLKNDKNEFFERMLETEFNGFYVYSLIIYWMDENDDEYLIRYLMHFKDNEEKAQDIWDVLASETENKIESLLEINI